MASRSPPRYVVRVQHDETKRRRRWLWLGGAWLASLALAVVVTLATVGHAPGTHGDDRRLAALIADHADLQQQLANLQRARQVDEIATHDLRGTLAEREEEISGLRADLGFYARLVGGDAQRQGLKVQEIHVQPVAGTNGWNLALSLTQNAHRGEEVHGRLGFDIEGLRGGVVTRLAAGPALGMAASNGDLPFRFKYFQLVQATFVLPPGFRPVRLHVHAQTEGAEADDRSIAWNDALDRDLTTTHRGI
jgi:hypothetical protein